MNTVRLFIVLLLLVPFSCAAPFTFDKVIGAIPNVNSVDVDGRRKVFDFIVVGSGASGSVVAARLANETNKKVLLLEGGALGTGQRAVGGTDYVLADFETDPVTGQQTLGTPLTRYDAILFWDTVRAARDVLDSTWNVSGVGPTPFFLQAKVIGGNQASNGGNWYTPTDIDFDHWNIPGFTGADMRPYFKKVENATDLGFPNRGTSGPINLRFASFIPQDNIRYKDAALAAGYSMAGDIGSGTLVQGIYETPQSSKAGVRTSSSANYLAKVLYKSNLDFRTSAVVTKVLFNSNNRSIGVEYVNKQGQTRHVYATGEVILAAGELQVCKILYNSGIGPASILNAFGKPHIVVNEIIGQKIRNHLRSGLTYFDPTLVNPNFYTLSAASNQFASTGTGLLDKSNGYAITYFSNTTKYSYPDIMINAGGTAGGDPAGAYGQRIPVTVTLGINRYANGSINLTSSDPLAGITYNSNSFLIEDDVEAVAKGFMEARRIMGFWEGEPTELTPGAGVQTLDELKDWVRTHPNAACHYHGGVPMGLDSSAPCDTKWRVRGVSRLRIVGPSIAPGPVYIGMQGLANVLGEKGTDLIKADYGL
jgi:choline dehydrogenase